MNSQIGSEGSLLLAIDIGTTALKAGIFTKTGEVCALSYNEYPLIYLSDNFIEQDALLWWSLTKQSIAECVEKIPSNRRRDIKVLGISTQGIAIVPVNHEGTPLANAISWLDTRGVDEAKVMEEHFGAEYLFNTTGVPPNPVWMLPKIMWVKKNLPEIYSRIESICTCQDFIIQRLTGSRVTDHSIAGGSMMYNMKKCDWSKEILDFGNIPIEKLPKLGWAGEVVGKMFPHVAKELGLPRDVQVVLGGHDQQCAGLGGGLRKDRITVSLGTASIIQGSLSYPVWDSKMRIPCLASVEKDKWVLESAVNIGGSGLQWLRDLLRGFSDKVLPDAKALDYGALIELAMLSEEGSGDVRFYPHMTGATSPYWVSGTGMFDGLSLSCGISDIVRAVMEGWCYQIKHNAKIIQSLSNDVEEVVVFGGGAKSDFLTELLANVLDIPILVTKTPETALLGAAMVAGTGCGIYNNIPEAQEQAVHYIKRVLPRKKSASVYKGLFEEYISKEKYLLRVSEL